MQPEPTAAPCVCVEYFGPIRLRTRVAAEVFHARNVGELLGHVCTRHPELSPTFIGPQGQPRACVVILNAKRVVTDLQIPLREGDRLLLATPDLGG